MKKLSFKTKNLLLTGMASVGVIATGVSAAKASFDAVERLRMFSYVCPTFLIFQQHRKKPLQHLHQLL